MTVECLGRGTPVREVLGSDFPTRPTNRGGARPSPVSDASSALCEQRLELRALQCRDLVMTPENQ